MVWLREGGRMGWVERASAPVATIEKRTLAAVVAGQSRRYGKNVQRRVALALAVVAAMLLYLGVVSLLYRTQQLGAAILEVRPFSAATIVGIYTGLGATVVALQFGARSVLDSASADVQANARNLVQRSFLEVLAWVALLTSVTIGLLTAYWYADFPAHVDIGRIAGALTASAFLAFTAAETQLLMATPLSDELRARVMRQRIMLLKRTLRDRLPEPVSARRLLPQRLAVFVVAPAVSIGFSTLVLPTTSGWMLVGRVLIVAGATGTAYMMVRGIRHAVSDRKTSTLFAIIIVGFVVGLSLLTSIGQAVLSDHGARTSMGDLARGLLGLWVAAILLPLTTMTLAAAHGKRVVGFIVHDVRAATQRRLDRLMTATSAETKPPLGRFVWWAWAGALVFPFGVLLGLIAARDAVVHGHRGRRAATAAAWVCTALAVAGVAAVVFVACWG